jgi:hypothetical protein
MPGFMKDVIGSGVAPLVAQNINGVGQGAQTATGSTQADAFALTTCSTEFTTVAASTGARLPAPGLNVGPGDILAVYNQGASTLTVYPPVGFKIGLAATNAGVSVASGKSALFGSRGDGNYFAFLSA